MSTQAVTIEPHEQVVLAVVKSKLMDDRICHDLHHAVITAATERSLPAVIDMSDVQYVPSMGIGMLVNILKDLRKINQLLLLANCQNSVRQVLALTRMDKLFPMHPTVDDAVRAATTS